MKSDLVRESDLVCALGNSKELEKRVSSEHFNKAILHMYVDYFC